MTRQSQKDEERSVLDWYLSHIGSSAKIVAAGEPPDFTLHNAGKTIGVELTAYTQQVMQGRHSMRATEAAWQSFLNFVRSERNKYNSLSGVNVWIEFQFGIMPGRKDYPAIVAEVAAMIAIKPPAKEFEYRYPEGQTLRRFVSKLRFRSVGVYMDWTWGGSAGAIGADDNEISSIVANKNAKVSKLSFDELWLIIYGGHTISQMLDFYDDDMSSFISTQAVMREGPFDRLILIGVDIRSWSAEEGWAVRKNS